MPNNLIDPDSATSLFKIIGAAFVVVLFIFLPLIITGLIYYFYLNKKIENPKGRAVVTIGIAILLYLILIGGFFIWGRF
jgi:hypothetical protein